VRKNVGDDVKLGTCSRRGLDDCTPHRSDVENPSVAAGEVMPLPEGGRDRSVGGNNVTVFEQFHFRELGEIRGFGVGAEDDQPGHATQGAPPANGCGGRGVSAALDGQALVDGPGGETA
jgi:hypothetical protein